MLARRPRRHECVRTLAAGSPPEAGHEARRRSRAELLKPADVCAQLKVSRAWLYRAAADGRIPSLRLGGPDGPVRFEPQEIAAWIERSRAAWRPGDSSAATLRRLS